MKSTANDAIHQLTQDHKEVKAMFKEYEKQTDRAKVTKKKLADQICDALTLHAQLEEEIFYPAVRSVVHDDDLMDEALVEHTSAKELIAQIRAMSPGDDLYDAKIKVLSEQIEHHVREEEGEMFALVRKSGLNLTALGEQMQTRRSQGPMQSAAQRVISMIRS